MLLMAEILSSGVTNGWGIFSYGITGFRKFLKLINLDACEIIGTTPPGNGMSYKIYFLPRSCCDWRPSC